MNLYYFIAQQGEGFPLFDDRLRSPVFDEETCVNKSMNLAPLRYLNRAGACQRTWKYPPLASPIHKNER